jgi:hypothetical protein
MNSMYALFFFTLIIFAVIMAIRLTVIALKMRNSQYLSKSGNSFLNTVFNTGNYGEFLTFLELEKMGESRILTNIYIPKSDGTTTEIDLLAITPTGIYVFESKNYSGWIFGDERNKMWTQTLKGGNKNKFFNPIWQNKGHISALDIFLEYRYSKHFHSYIVFSDRCMLKKLTITSTNVVVLNRCYLREQLYYQYHNSPIVFTEHQMDYIYNRLLPLTRVDGEVKKNHINAIQRKHGKY